MASCSGAHASSRSTPLRLRARLLVAEGEQISNACHVNHRAAQLSSALPRVSAAMSGEAEPKARRRAASCASVAAR